MNENYILDLIGMLEQKKSRKQINTDIKQLEKTINALRITGVFAKGNTKKELNAYIKQLSSQLSTLKLKGKLDSRNLKNEIDSALSKVKFGDIDVLDIDENKIKLKVRKVFADIKEYASRNPISVNVTPKKEKLNNDLTAYLNRNTKINESAVLLQEADRVRELIQAVDDKKSLREATDAFQLYKSEVAATGFNTKSTTDKIKSMLSQATKLGSIFGVASLAVNNFTNSLKTLRANDTILTEISKTSELTKQQLEEIGNASFKVASKYGKLSGSYLMGVQEMARAGYENSNIMAELSTKVQGAGDMTDELANKYIIATDKAFQMKGSVETLTAALDGANNITNNNALAMSDLAEAMSIIGSQAASSGMKVNETTAALSTMIAVTQQSGSQVANAFKGILMNLRQVTGEVEDGGEVIDAESLTKYEKACAELGVSLSTVKDGMVSLKEPMQIIRELSEAYTKLDESDARRANLLNAVGGKYRANALNSLLENYDMYSKMLQEYENGLGSMDMEAEKTAKSWEGRLNSLQNSFDSFLNMLTNKDAVLSGISLFDKLIQGAEALTDTIGEIPVVLTTLNTAMVAMNKDYGITKVWDSEKGKIDIQGNMFGIDFTAIKNMKKHFSEAEGAIAGWNAELVTGNADINKFNEAIVQNNAQLKAYLSTCSKEAPASLSGYKSYLNAAGVSTDSLRLKTILLNSVISMGIGLAIQAAVSGITYLIQRQEELHQNAKEGADAYKETVSSINDYVSKYQELQKALVEAKGNEEETYNVKKQLLTLQTELNDTYGEEYGKINLLADAYKDQTKTLKAYNKEAAQAYLNENRREIDRAVSQMTYKGHYDLSGSGVLGQTDEGKALIEIAQKYKEQGITIADEIGDGSFAQFSVHLNADPESAYKTINEFETELKAKAKELGNEYMFDDILNISSDSMQKAKSTIDEYGNIFRQALTAEITSDDNKTKIYSEALKAAEAYNEAVLRSENPYEDKTVIKAKEDLDSIKHTIRENETEWEKYSVLLDEIFGKADTRILEFTQALKTNTDIQQLAEDLNGLNHLDLESFDDIEGENESFDKLKESAEAYNLSAEELIDTLVRLGYVQGEVQNSIQNMENPISFNLSTYKDQLSDIQSSISTLRSALDSLNSGDLSKIEVIDLMQKFPELAPYIDLTADGFGNLSEGLSKLMEQQPSSLINELEKLKASLNTDEEREQVDLLIDSLQRLSSYGDSGLEAYAASMGNTWTDTKNVIDGVITQFENLAKVQEAVSNGLTMSAMAATELAKIYPEILTNATVTADGQMKLNEEVVKNILAGDQSIINAQIAKLEADKAGLEAKQKVAIAELEIAKNVGTAKGQITEEEARNQIEALEAELQAELDKDKKVVESYATATESKMNNASQFNTHAGQVASDVATNMLNAAVSMAANMKVNAENSQQSLTGIGHKAAEVAKSIIAMSAGESVDVSDKIFQGKGGSKSGAIKIVNNTRRLSSATRKYLDGNSDLEDFKSQLEIDIQGYTDAISNIDSQINVLKNLQATFTNAAGSGIGGHGYADKIKDLEKEKDKINKALDDAKSGGGSAGDTKDEYEELFDFFEQRIKVLSAVLSLLKSGMDNVIGSFAKNSLIDAQLNVTEEKFNNYTDALAMYTQKANEALSELPTDIAQKIKDGAVDLTTFIGEGNEGVVEAIKVYQTWADKVSDCRQELEELKTSIRQLELDKFNNIAEDFANQFNLHEDGKDLISKQIDLLKEAGELIGESFFTTQIDQSKKQLEVLENEKEQLVDQLSSALSSGRIEKGTDEWLEMVNALSDVEGSIIDCQKAIEEFDNELLNLNWQIFERVQTEFGNISSELDNLAGLFDDFNDIRVSDGKGTWTKEAIATLGLYAQQYEIAKYQVGQYGEAIDKLNEDYASGKYSATEYADKLADLTKEQWSVVNSAESLEDSIIKLNETRVNEEIKVIEDEIDAYKKLTDSQIEALRASKDLHDYEQSIAEKTKNITDIERQLIAMQNDNTAATIAKRKKLEEELSEAKKDLAETEYEHSIEAQEDALNKQYEDFEAARNAEIEALKATLEDRETLLSQSFETVKGNADIVGQEIAAIATEHGVTISNTILTSWQNGEKAIASYGDVLSSESSAFIGNIIGVENEVYHLQSQANAAADTLSYMFATRADNLVEELTTSYLSEANLNDMTQLLQDSLVNTLERGYNISSIESAFNSIVSGANEAAEAANKAASAIDRMNDSAGGGSYSGYSSNTSNRSSSGTGYTPGLMVSAGAAGNTIKSTPGTGTVTSAVTATIKPTSGVKVSSGAASAATKQTGTGALAGIIGATDSLKKKYNIKGYSKGGLITKDDKNPLNEVAEAVGEDTMIAVKEGEYVLNTEQVKKWGYKPTPEQIQYFRELDSTWKHAQMTNDIGTIWNLTGLQSNTKMPEHTRNNKPNISMHYDSLITVNGDVNDTNHFLKQIQGVSQKVVNNTLKKIDRDFKYHGY